MVSQTLFISAVYPMKEAGETEPLEVVSREAPYRLDVVLHRGGIVIGHVIDEYGDPIPEATVTPMLDRSSPGEQLLQPGPRVRTNDLGEFRLFGLRPGPYLLSVEVRCGTGCEEGQYVPIYYPSTPRIADAGVITLSAERMTVNADVSFQRMRSARISGAAVDSEGKPMAQSEVIVFLTGARSFPVARGEVKADGTFAVLGLGPGEYRLEVRPSIRNRNQLVEEARTTVSVDGADVADVWLVGQKKAAASSKPTK